LNIQTDIVKRFQTNQRKETEVEEARKENNKTETHSQRERYEREEEKASYRVET
jgi:hypothetical protein